MNGRPAERVGRLTRRRKRQLEWGYSCNWGYHGTVSVTWSRRIGWGGYFTDQLDPGTGQRILMAENDQDTVCHKSYSSRFPSSTGFNSGAVQSQCSI